MGECSAVLEGVPQCERVCPSVEGCYQCRRKIPVWEGVPLCGSVCPSVGQCSSVLEGVPQCVRV